MAPRALLLRVAAEAVILQDQADEVLHRIRAHAPLGETARPTGTLVRRFFRLRAELPEHFEDPDDESLRADLSVILHHHAELLSMASQLSAYEWRSERLRAQVESLEGTGLPGQRLDRLWRDLADGSAPTEPSVA